jgi:hypothetical protein
MVLRNRRQFRLLAILVMVTAAGCGTADDGEGENDTVGEPTVAAGQKQCVNIIQEHDLAALGYSQASAQVFTDRFWRAPDPRFTWCIEQVSNLNYRIRPYDLQSTKEMDAYESTNDYNVVLRSFQNNTSQIWSIVPGISSGTYRLQQVSTGRLLDAYTSTTNRRAVTRTPQSDATQRWYIEDVGCTCD